MRQTILLVLIALSVCSSALGQRADELSTYNESPSRLRGMIEKLLAEPSAAAPAKTAPRKAKAAEKANG